MQPVRPSCQKPLQEDGCLLHADRDAKMLVVLVVSHSTMHKEFEESLIVGQNMIVMIVLILDLNQAIWRSP
jgi:hypothetical protein